MAKANITTCNDEERNGTLNEEDKKIKERLRRYQTYIEPCVNINDLIKFYPLFTPGKVYKTFLAFSTIDVLFFCFDKI